MGLLSSPSSWWMGRSIFVITAMAVMAMIAAGCGSDLPTGAWTGDLNGPGVQGVWGVTWHVDADPEGELTIAFEAPSRARTRPTSLGVHGDSLRFSFPGSKSISCEAARQNDGSWQGTCMPKGDTGTIGITMVPPDQTVPVGAARLALRELKGEWQVAEAGRALVYTRPGTDAHANLDRVTREARRAVSRAVETLRAQAWKGPVHLVYLESRDEMKRVVGRAVRGAADAGGNAILLVTDAHGGSPVHHEMAHVVSLRKWKAAHKPGGWVQEGLAEWVQGATCGTVSHGRLDFYLHRRGDGLSLDTLTTAFWERSDRITMPQATTLVQYIVDEHGFEALRHLWKRGIEASGEVVGLSAEDLEEAWRAWVQAHYEPATEDEWRSSMGREQGCPWPDRISSSISAAPPLSPSHTLERPMN